MCLQIETGPIYLDKIIGYVHRYHIISNPFYCIPAIAKRDGLTLIQSTNVWLNTVRKIEIFTQRVIHIEYTRLAREWPNDWHKPKNFSRFRTECRRLTEKKIKSFGNLRYDLLQMAAKYNYELME